MSSSAVIIIEMLITLGVCLGFGVHQLWDLRREKAKDAAKAEAAARDEDAATSAAKAETSSPNGGPNAASAS